MSEDITKNNQISEKNLDKMRELVDVLNDASKAYYPRKPGDNDKPTV